MEIMNTGTFTEWQQALDTEFSKSAESFIRIGYLLKMARDTDILKDTPYQSVTEYAKARYGLDKTQVSRFIAINERFGSKNNETELGDRYKGYGYAKLALMLNMPDEIISEISPEYSKSEIEDIKKEIDEENKISDIEVLIEGKDESIKEYSELEQVLHQLFRDNTELFENIYESTYETAELVDILAPAGEMIYSVRLSGIGRLMLNIKADTGKITITNIRTLEKTEWNIEDLAIAVINVLSVAADTENPKDAWVSIYNEPYPEKAEVAPVQQVQRKEKKVQKAKVEKPQPEKTEEREAPSEDEQIPGQDTVMNHPEYLPENSNNMPEAQENTQDNTVVMENMTEKPSDSSEMIKIPGETPDFEKDVQETEKTEPEMLTNAINTRHDDTSDNINEFMDCWEQICAAHRRIAGFIEVYSTSDTTLDNMAIESARIDAVTLANELEHLKTL